MLRSLMGSSNTHCAAEQLHLSEQIICYAHRVINHSPPRAHGVSTSALEYLLKHKIRIGLTGPPLGISSRLSD